MRRITGKEKDETLIELQSATDSQTGGNGTGPISSRASSLLSPLALWRSGFFSEERHRGKTSSTLIRQTIIIVTSQSSNIKMLFESFKCQHEVFECHSITYALVTCLLPNYTGLCFF